MTGNGETREEIEEAVQHMCTTAKRKYPVVGSADHPTDWDRAHERINALLDALDQAPVLT